MTPQRHCPDCSGAMMLGYIADKADSNINTQSYWAPGIPKRIRLFGFGAQAIKAPKRSEALAVTVYRCQSCGRLQMYANDKVTRGGSASDKSVL